MHKVFLRNILLVSEEDRVRAQVSEGIRFRALVSEERRVKAQVSEEGRFRAPVPEGCGVWTEATFWHRVIWV